MIGKIKSLRELFEIELGYAYDCEKKLAEKGLPTMIESASSTDLRMALEDHWRETQEHVARLEHVFSIIGVEPNTKSNDVIDKMTSAVKDSISNIESSPLRDAALIVNGNLAEHYEIATYGSLAAFARSLGLTEVGSLLAKILDQEKKADAKLSQIGEKVLNPQAARHQSA